MSEPRPPLYQTTENITRSLREITTQTGILLNTYCGYDRTEVVLATEAVWSGTWNEFRRVHSLDGDYMGVTVTYNQKNRPQERNFIGLNDRLVKGLVNNWSLGENIMNNTRVLQRISDGGIMEWWLVLAEELSHVAFGESKRKVGEMPNGVYTEFMGALDKMILIQAITVGDINWDDVLPIICSSALRGCGTETGVHMPGHRLAYGLFKKIIDLDESGQGDDIQKILTNSKKMSQKEFLTWLMSENTEKKWQIAIPVYSVAEEQALTAMFTEAGVAGVKDFFEFEGDFNQRQVEKSRYEPIVHNTRDGSTIELLYRGIIGLVEGGDCTLTVFERLAREINLLKPGENAWELLENLNTILNEAGIEKVVKKEVIVAAREAIRQIQTSRPRLTPSTRGVTSGFSRK